MKKLWLSVLLGCISLGCMAGIFDWSIYPTMASYSRIEQVGEHYYLLCGHALLSSDTDFKQMHTYTALDGLSGTEVFDFAFDTTSQTLCVVYTDGNIDFVKTSADGSCSGSVVNLPDFANASVMADRTLLGIGNEGGLLYLSTGLGILEVDIDEALIRETLNPSEQSERVEKALDALSKHGNQPELAALLKNLDVPNGTQVELAARMVIAHNKLYCIESTYMDIVGSSYGPGRISILDLATDTWQTITAAQLNPSIKKLDSYSQFAKLTGIAVDPNDEEHLYVSSMGYGIYEIEGDSVTHLWNAHLNPEGMSSALRSNDQQLALFTRVGNIMLDDNNYLWFTNGNELDETSLRAITPDNKIIKYPTPNFAMYANSQHSLASGLFEAKYDTYRFKWATRTFHINSPAVEIYYDNHTPEDLSDDQRSVFTSITDQDGNVYHPSYFLNLTEDHSGALWLLTTIGPFIIDDPVSCFNKPGYVRRVKIPRNDGTNLADYLLGGVRCRCCVVDAANRKWIGTEGSGLFLISADGLTQIEHFTTENSPLFTNTVVDLAYDETSGKLFIATTGGVCCYESNASTSAQDNSNIYCYPNPVRPEYSGKLNIVGSEQGSTVIVTDSQHHTVMRTTSEGAMIRWDLRNNDGKRVKPGVYFIISVDADGNEGGKFKFLVM